MPERLDRVTVALSRADFVFGWEARQALLERLYNANIRAGMMTWGASTDDILRAFEAVGATRPVELTRPQRTLLLRVLRTWSEEERWALEPDGRMPEELATLREALGFDLRASEPRQT